MLKAKIILFTFFYLLTTFSLVAQTEDEFLMEEEEAAATMEEEIDSKIGKWNLVGYGAFKDSVAIDTLLDEFHIYHPMYKNAITTTYLGNYGTPFINNDFFGRDPAVDFFFVQSRGGYLLTPQQIEYYNTTTPFTQLDFSQSENKARKSETRFNVLHSQNVSPFLNFTFRFDQAKSEGQYPNQSAKNNFVTLYSSYNKDNVSIHGGFISNSIKNKENGGLINDSLIFEPGDTDYLTTNLSNSGNNFNSSYFFADTEYKLGKYEPLTDSTDYFRPIGGVIYSVQYERHKQEFLEEELNDSLFWDNTYYGDDYYNDSIRFNILTNTIQLKQYENKERKTSFGKRAFLGHEFIYGSSPGINEEISNRQQIRYSNLFAGGGIYRQTGKNWRWNFDGKIYLIGRDAGQTEINGLISRKFTFWKDSLAAVIIDGSILNIVADPFQQEFYSNHIKWKNDFRMEQRMMANGKFVSPERKLEIGAKYAIISNFIYNDTLGMPAQTSKEQVILSAYFDKDFNYRNLHLRTRVLWQKASNESVLHLPDFSAFVSAYYQLLISKVLYTQFGVDTRYNTAYYADAYAPSTGLFYLQNEKKYGNYPYIDVHANLRLKRTTVFFKLMNIGSNFLAGEYITTPNYPMPKSTFRFGVTWAFYD